MIEKTFFIASSACMRNRTVTQQVYDFLVANGYKFLKDATIAELIVIDTCAFRQSKEDYSFELVDYYFKHKSPSSRVFVIGCMPGINPKRLAQYEEVVQISSKNIHQIETLIDVKVPFGDIPIRDVPQDFLSHVRRAYINLFKKSGKTHFNRLMDYFRYLRVRKNFDPFLGEVSEKKRKHLVISRGCLGSCAYCAIRFAWGRLESRPLTQITEEFSAIVNDSSEEVLVWLETQDLGGYGTDIGTDIVTLLQQLFAAEGRYKVALSDLNANWLIRYYEPLKEVLLKNKEHIWFLDVAIQSASDRVLKLMNRPYEIGDVKKCLFDLTRSLPDVIMNIQMMVGFPGESQADFEETERFVKEFAVFPNALLWHTGYTDRPGTPASHMTNKVSGTEIEKKAVASERTH